MLCSILRDCLQMFDLAISVQTQLMHIFMLLYVFPFCESSAFKEVQQALFPSLCGNTMPVIVLMIKNAHWHFLFFIIKQKVSYLYSLSWLQTYFPYQTFCYLSFLPVLPVHQQNLLALMGHFQSVSMNNLNRPSLIKK